MRPKPGHSIKLVRRNHTDVSVARILEIDTAPDLYQYGIMPIEDRVGTALSASGRHIQGDCAFREG